MLPEPPVPHATGVWAVLQNPGYRQFLIAAIMVSAGIWICETALLYLIQTQTHSSTVVGEFLAVVTVPFVAGAFWGGLLTDRFGPRPLMASAAIAWAAAIGVGCLLALANGLTLVPVLVIGFILGAFDSAWTVPIQVMAAATVERKLTAAAIAAFPLQYGAGRLLGGFGGGLLVALSGVPLALGVACLALVVGGLLLLSVPYDSDRVTKMEVASADKSGAAVRWVATDRVTLTVVVLAALTSTITFSYVALLPAIALNALGSGATGLGSLTAAAGIGILLLSMLTNRLGAAFGRGRVILVAVAATSIALIILAVSRNVILSALACAAAGGLLMVFLSTSSLILQAWSPPGIKGRVVSIHSLVFWGALPIGAILVGSASDRVGPQTVLLTCAVASLGCVVAIVLVNSGFTAVDVDSAGRPIQIAKS